MSEGQPINDVDLRRSSSASQGTPPSHAGCQSFGEQRGSLRGGHVQVHRGHSTDSRITVSNNRAPSSRPQLTSGGAPITNIDLEKYVDDDLVSKSGESKQSCRRIAMIFNIVFKRLQQLRSGAAMDDLTACTERISQGFLEVMRAQHIQCITPAVRNRLHKFVDDNV